MILKLLFAFACLMVFAPSFLVVGAPTCPNPELITPCYCSTHNTNFLYLNCASQSLSDNRINAIIQYFPKEALGQVNLYNNPLTRVPAPLKECTHLGSLVDISRTGITSIQSGAFQFLDNTNPLNNLNLNSNSGLTTISPNAFNGIKAFKDTTKVNLDGHKLSRFEATVFQPLLEKFAQYGGLPFAHVSILTSPPTIDCSGCNLAWLVRYHPELKIAISGGVCSNGTSFNLLTAVGYATCPEFSCPLGYDGNYYDPSDRCHKYYTCLDGTPYPAECALGLVFNPDTGSCTSANQVPGC